VLKPGGFLSYRSFIWPIPRFHDEYRYSLLRYAACLNERDFPIPHRGDRRPSCCARDNARAMGRRRALTSRAHVSQSSAVIATLAVIWLLLNEDERPARFEESTMIVGLSAKAFKSE